MPTPYGEVGDPMLPRKPLASHEPPVPQTDSGDQVENTKAIETTMVKELGKCPRNFGRRGT